MSQLSVNATKQPFIKDEKSHRTVLLSNDTNLCIKAMTYGITTISVKEGKPLTAPKTLSSLDAMVNPQDKQAGSDINASKYASPSPSLPVAPTPDVSVTNLQASSDTAALSAVNTLQ
ncbi:hypothetical protein BZA77DRAFT_294528 [Pyronema omphalodes]|nr:hypothetical protein BZA77DRAFT_294528 [Pyronema omphalodes]